MPALVNAIASNRTLQRERRVDVRGYLADCRDLAVDEIRRIVAREAPLGAPLYELMLDYPLRDAKGMRPALCIATCRALGGNERACLPTAAVLELYHNAFLIHDDIEDGSELRRDSPTLHRLHGVPVAINVGDAMLALTLPKLLENTRLVGLAKTLRVFSIIADMARETAEGQALELDWIRNVRFDVSDDEYRTMVVKKTAWYTFIAPIALGAVLAGASDDRVATLRRFAEELGIAFQIRDDVLNVDVAHGRYGKEAYGDLWEGKRTLILLHMLRSVSTKDRVRAERILAKGRPADDVTSAGKALLAELARDGHVSKVGRERLERLLFKDAALKTSSDIRFLVERIRDSGSVQYADAIARQHAERARGALREAFEIPEAVQPSSHASVLEALIEFAIGRDH